MTVLVSEIINRAKQRASIPDGSPSVQSTGLLNFAQESMDEVVFPYIHGLNEDFLLITETLDLQSSGTILFPTGEVPIPSRCYGRSITELKYKDSSNNLYNMPLANLSEEDLFLRNAVQSQLYQGAPAFFVRGDCVRLCAAPSSLTGSLVFTYALKAPTLVSSSTLHADIVNMVYSSGTTTITTSATGTDFNTYLPDTNPDAVKRVDLYRKTSGQYIKIDLILTRTGATSFTTTGLTSDEVTAFAQYQRGGFTNIAYYSSDLAILPAEQNNYAPIPQELDNYFVLAVSGRYLESIGDTEGLQVNELKMQKEEKAAAKALAKRVNYEAKVICNRRGIRTFFNPGWIRRT
jgi:hypothetical protein